MSDFGMAPMKAEGMAAHPDIYDNAGDMSDEWYVRQMAAYVEWSGDEGAPGVCARFHLFVKESANSEKIAISAEIFRRSMAMGDRAETLLRHYRKQYREGLMLEENRRAEDPVIVSQNDMIGAFIRGLEWMKEGARPWLT